ncbi:MAG: hypothetical protein M1374_02685 [Firmicutes bacterium]|nr:hypothetical protein [Bacillota bacterium]
MVINEHGGGNPDAGPPATVVMLVVFLELTCVDLLAAVVLVATGLLALFVAPHADKDKAVITSIIRAVLRILPPAMSFMTYFINV